jgi:predicted  nucleic acid-binding Zn-ribbon protein
LSAQTVLVELAHEDARLYQLRQQIASLPRRLQELEIQRADLQVQLQDCEAVYQRNERERRKLDLDLQDCRAKRVKSEGRLAALTSTEQYQALQREIQQQDTRIDDLESSLLEAMDRSAQALVRRDQETTRLQGELARLDDLQLQLEADLQRARDGVAAQRERRDGLIGQLEPKTRALYERVLRAKGDAAIALLGDRRCGICAAVQPPQRVQELRGGTTTLRTCQNCGRILIWDPATGSNA